MIAALSEVPLSTSIPAFSVGADACGKSAFNVMIESPTFNSVVFTYVVVPEIVKSPVTTTLPEMVPPADANFVFANVYAELA